MRSLKRTIPWPFGNPRTDAPALVITNVALPGITGHDAMRLFKQCSPDTPVLMIPGIPESDVITKWKDQDGFDVFPKPFMAGDLRTKVREMLSLNISGRSARP